MFIITFVIFFFQRKGAFSIIILYRGRNKLLSLLFFIYFFLFFFILLSCTRVALTSNGELFKYVTRVCHPHYVLAHIHGVVTYSLRNIQNDNRRKILKSRTKLLLLLGGSQRFEYSVIVLCCASLESYTNASRTPAS